MEKTSQDLINEHNAIQIALDVIEKMYGKVSNNEKIEQADIGLCV